MPQAEPIITSIAEVNNPRCLARLDSVGIDVRAQFKPTSCGVIDHCSSNFKGKLSYPEIEYLLNWLCSLKGISDNGAFLSIIQQVLDTKYLYKSLDFRDRAGKFEALVLKRPEVGINAKRKDEQKVYDVGDFKHSEFYGLKQSCYLCQTTARMRKKEENGENSHIKIEETSTAILIANKFPVFAGHGLIVQTEHEKNPRKQNRVNHKLDPEYLREVALLCDSYELVGWMNNPTGGMSIPAHNHFHVALKSMGIPGFDNLITTQDKLRNRRKENVPFETFVISSPEPSEAIKKVISLAEEYEAFKLSYNIAYSNGCWLFIPRYDIDVDRINNHHGGVVLGAPIGLQFFFRDSEFYSDEFQERMAYAFTPPK